MTVVLNFTKYVNQEVEMHGVYIYKKVRIVIIEYKNRRRQYYPIQK